MNFSQFKSILLSQRILERALILSFVLFALISCSGKIEIGLGKAKQLLNGSGVILVNVEGTIDRSLSFDSSDESNFLNYSFDW